MSDLRQAAQQALEALEQSRVFVTTREKIKHPEGVEWYDEAITSLKQALAEPEQEPCAMRYDFDGYGYKYIDSGSGSNWQTRHKDAEPLYTAPTPQPDTDCHLQGICQASGYSIAPTPRRPQTTHWEGCEAVHPECKAIPTPQPEHDTDCHQSGICQRSGYSIGEQK